MTNAPMWVEKYRPKTIDDIVGHVKIKEKLKGFLKHNATPHLLFAGPPGTGKTTAILAFANELFKDSVSSNLLELNASDDRGIETIRNEVKEFAMTLPSGNNPYKIIVLDEADALTSAAQNALRRTMERFAHTSRFALLCNYPGKIIEPIQSRCAYFRFKPLSKLEIEERIKYVIDKEKIQIDKLGIETLIKVSSGDLRKALNILQASASLQKSIDASTILEITGHANPEMISKIIKQSNENFEQARKMLIDLIYVEGVSGREIIREMYNQLANFQFSPSKKLEIIQLLAEIDFRISEGASSDIQLTLALIKFQDD